MGKFRHRMKGSKGKRWAKGHSSSSNPSTSNHREAAKSRFFQDNLGKRVMSFYYNVIYTKGRRAIEINVLILHF